MANVNLPSWHKGDAVSSRKLTDMVDAIADLQDDLDIIATTTTGGGIDAQSAKYRDVGMGTDDLGKEEEVGIYASAPVVAMGDGSIADGFEIQEGEDGKSVRMPEGADIFLKITTDNFGNPTGAEYVGAAGEQKMYNPQNEEGGEIYYPIAHAEDDTDWATEVKPQRVLNYNTARLPYITADVSFNPDGESEEEPEEGGVDPQVEDEGEEETKRTIQGTKWVDAIEGNVIPVRGLNNHGGLKILSPDTDGEHLTSNAVKVHVEMYGIAGTPDENEEVGSATAGDGVDGGTLAKWRFIRAGEDDGSSYQEISLAGGHLDDWQLTFQGNGFVTLPVTKVGSEEGDDEIPVWKTDVSRVDDRKHGYMLGIREGRHKIEINEYDELKVHPMAENDWETIATIYIGGVEIGSKYVEDEKLEWEVTTDDEGNGVIRLTEYTRQISLSKDSDDVVDITATEWAEGDTNDIIYRPSVYDFGIEVPSAEASTGTDYRYEFSTAANADGSSKLTITQYTREETFSQTDNTIKDEFGAWAAGQTWDVVIPAPTPEKQWTVNGSTGTDYKYDFTLTPAGTGSTLTITEQSRNEVLTGDGATRTITQTHGAYGNTGNKWEIPIPGQVTPTEYTFDSNWFEVTNNNVRLRTSALNSVVNEALNELQFEVNVSGLADDVHDGRIYASTSAAGRIGDNPSTIPTTYSHEAK
ncbi:unnamed protein product [Cylicocyclus nassatus]|uniref:Uncharacterized protein n=1 Tax=Cylicocyclus nassatus TaxID=53992 RepID=A0AA36GQQ8_CYLNA|nr:unnamed protein product [Cylicocyclus nassatus]